MVLFCILDRATRFSDAIACIINSTEQASWALQVFYGVVKPKCIHIDAASELIAACKGLGFSHDCSTPHRSQSNGVAERFVRRAKEGTACQVQQSGMCVAWWHLAARMYCFLYNVCEKVVKCEDGTWSYPSS